MKGTTNDKLRLSILAVLSVTAATPFFPVCRARAADQAPAATDAQAQTVAQNKGASAAAGNENTSLDTIIVTGVTSQRTLLDSSVDVTPINAAQIEQKAPRSTVDVLQLIPGVYVESTAGPVSNNYSVRGLPGGGQSFIMLEEDGMPVLYGGGGSDEYFQNDISVDHVEALQGGSSGILSPNAAGMSVNFISRPLNFDEGEGIGKVMAATYGEQRADLYYSGPIKALGDGVAYMVGGYVDSDKGQRSSPFTYSTYHIKSAIEKKWDDGAFVKITYKRWDEHDPYYADMPYRYVGGQIEGVPGLSTQYGNVLGPGFASIGVPDSCATGSCFRNFNGSEGIHATGNQYRIDVNAPHRRPVDPIRPIPIPAIQLGFQRDLPRQRYRQSGTRQRAFVPHSRRGVAHQFASDGGARGIPGCYAVRCPQSYHGADYPCLERRRAERHQRQRATRADGAQSSIPGDPRFRHRLGR